MEEEDFNDGIGNINNANAPTQTATLAQQFKEFVSEIFHQLKINPLPTTLASLFVFSFAVNIIRRNEEIITDSWHQFLWSTIEQGMPFPSDYYFQQNYGADEVEMLASFIFYTTIVCSIVHSLIYNRKELNITYKTMNNKKISSSLAKRAPYALASTVLAQVAYNEITDQQLIRSYSICLFSCVPLFLLSGIVMEAGLKPLSNIVFGMIPFLGSTMKNISSTMYSLITGKRLRDPLKEQDDKNKFIQVSHMKRVVLRTASKISYIFDVRTEEARSLMEWRDILLAARALYTIIPHVKGHEENFGVVFDDENRAISVIFNQNETTPIDYNFIETIKQLIHNKDDDERLESFNKTFSRKENIMMAITNMVSFFSGDFFGKYDSDRLNVDLGHTKAEIKFTVDDLYTVPSTSRDSLKKKLTGYSPKSLWTLQYYYSHRENLSGYSYLGYEHNKPQFRVLLHSDDRLDFENLTDEEFNALERNAIKNNILWQIISLCFMKHYNKRIIIRRLIEDATHMQNSEQIVKQYYEVIRDYFQEGDTFKDTFNIFNEKNEVNDKYLDELYNLLSVLEDFREIVPR